MSGGLPPFQRGPLQSPCHVGVPFVPWGTLSQGGAGSSVPNTARCQQRLPAQVHQCLPKKSLLQGGSPCQYPSTPPVQPCATPSPPPWPERFSPIFPIPICSHPTPFPSAHPTCRYGGNMSSSLLFFRARRFFFSSPSAEPGSRPPSAGRSPGAPTNSITTPVTTSSQGCRKSSAMALSQHSRMHPPVSLHPWGWGGHHKGGGGQVLWVPTILWVPLCAQPLTSHFSQHRWDLLQAGVGLALPHHEATDAWGQRRTPRSQRVQGGVGLRAAMGSTHQVGKVCASSSCTHPGPPAPSPSPHQPPRRGRGWLEPPA